MFITAFDIVCIIGGGISAFLWIVLLLYGRKYDKMFSALSEDEFKGKELYSTGYAFMNLIHYNYKSKRDRTLRQQLEILYEKKYVEYYLRVLYAQGATVMLLFCVLSFAFYGISGEAIMVPLMWVFGATLFYYCITSPQKKIDARSAEMLGDFADVVAKLALLTNAGMILREAWDLISKSGETAFYKEMKLAMTDMNNGISDSEAIRRFGVRCMIPEAKKFSSTIVQGIQMGNKELSAMLQQQSGEVWNLRKQNARREGEKAAGKLMIPIFIMFFGILIMIVIPIFANIGV